MSLKQISYEIKGNEEHGEELPPGTYCNLVAVIAEGSGFRTEPVMVGEIDGNMTVSLWPGRYRMVLKKDDITFSAALGASPGGGMAFHILKEFYAGVNEAGWRKLCTLKPKMSRGVLTSSGTKWTCNFSGCGKRMNNAFAIALHEIEHQGGSIEKMLGTDKIDEIHEVDDPYIKVHKKNPLAKQTPTVSTGKSRIAMEG